jgi:hypothetical protein
MIKERHIFLLICLVAFLLFYKGATTISIMTVSIMVKSTQKWHSA